MNTHRLIRIPILKLLIVALILLVVGGFAVLISLVWPLIHIPLSQPPIHADPLEMVNVFHSAVNSNNVDAMMALFAEDATLSDDGLIFHGKDEIRKWVLSSQRMAGLHLEMVHSQVAGEKIFWQDMAYNDPQAKQRVYLLRWMAVIQQGKIQSLTVSLLPMPDAK